MQIRLLAVMVICASSVLSSCGEFQHRASARPRQAHIQHAPTVPATHLGVRDRRYHKFYAQYKGWKGTPYREGGSDKHGIDCSGFVQRTFKDQFQMSLPRSTALLQRYGTPIRRSELRVGDLVLFKTGIFARHVAIYIGKGKILHAASSHGVSISTMRTGYWAEHYWQSRRVF